MNQKAGSQVVSRFRSHGLVPRPCRKVCYQGLVQMFCPEDGFKVWSQGFFTRFGPEVMSQGCIPRDGSQDLGLVPKVWFQGLDPKVAQQGLATRFGPMVWSNVVYKGWVPRP